MSLFLQLVAGGLVVRPAAIQLCSALFLGVRSEFELQAANCLRLSNDSLLILSFIFGFFFPVVTTYSGSGLRSRYHLFRQRFKKSLPLIPLILDYRYHLFRCFSSLRPRFVLTSLLQAAGCCFSFARDPVGVVVPSPRLVGLYSGSVISSRGSLVEQRSGVISLCSSSVRLQNCRYICLQ